MPIIFVAVAVALLMQSKWIERNTDKFVDPLVSRLFRQVFSATYLPVQCPHCEGQGVVTDAENEASCPVCFGVGVHYIRIAGDKKVICPTCQGMGRTAEFGATEALFCERCGGRGLLKGHNLKGANDAPAHILQIECDECTGNGYLRNHETGHTEVCPLCFGLGYHWSRKTADNDQICPACGGVGRAIDPDTDEAHWCGRCAGRGLVLSESTGVTSPQ